MSKGSGGRPYPPNPVVIFVSLLVVSLIVLVLYYSGNGLTPSSSDVISLASAYLLVILIYVSALPMFKKPHLRIDPDSLEWEEFEAKNPEGNFKAGLLLVSITNESGFLSKKAEGCQMGLQILGRGSEAFGLPWYNREKLSVDVDEPIDPADPQMVMNALLASKVVSFEDKVIRMGHLETALVGFTNQTGDFYISTKEPVSLSAPSRKDIKEKGAATTIPFWIIVSEPESGLTPIFQPVTVEKSESGFKAKMITRREFKELTGVDIEA